MVEVFIYGFGMWYGYTCFKEFHPDLFDQNLRHYTRLDQTILTIDIRCIGEIVEIKEYN